MTSSELLSLDSTPKINKNDNNKKSRNGKIFKKATGKGF